jgi:hypothetical protein
MSLLVQPPPLPTLGRAQPTVTYNSSLMPQQREQESGQGAHQPSPQAGQGTSGSMLWAPQSLRAGICAERRSNHVA